MLWELNYEYSDNRKCESFTQMLQRVFIALESCHIAGIEGLEGYFLLLKLMRDKYYLHKINEGEISLTPY